MNSIEIWKDIEGYSGYQVSNTGRIRSYKIKNSNKLREKPIILNQYKRRSNKKTYLYSRIGGKYAKNISTHRLVAMAFIPNPENKPQVNHKDNNPHNNHLNNLEWVTDKENKEHAFSIEAFKSGSLVLDKETGIYYNSIPQAAKAKNLNKNSLRAMLIGVYKNKTNLELV